MKSPIALPFVVLLFFACTAAVPSRAEGLWQTSNVIPVLNLPGQESLKPPSFVTGASLRPKGLPPRHERASLAPESISVASANNRFAFDLFKTLAADRAADEGLLFSPLSASAALTMTMAGARGDTEREMRTTLGYGGLAQESIHSGYGGLIQDLNTPREGYELRVANRLFGQERMPFKQPFLGTLSEDYSAPLERLNFADDPEGSREHINHWVEDQTNDRIINLLPKGSVQRQTAMVLTNALYFNGKWKHEFQEEATRDEVFTFADGGQALVSMMHQRERFRYGDFDGYQMLEMPYAGDDLSMVVMLPDEADGITELEATLDAQSFENDLAAMSHHEVILSLPKFRFEDRLALVEPLKQLGMEDVFTSSADFSGMSDEHLLIDKVLQKTFVDVNEGGTEAAAATAVVTSSTSIAILPPPVVFDADQPFLYAIRDTHSGAVMFLGRMTEPTLAESASVATPEPAAVSMLLAFALLPLGLRRNGLR